MKRDEEKEYRKLQRHTLHATKRLRERDVEHDLLRFSVLWIALRPDPALVEEFNETYSRTPGATNCDRLVEYLAELEDALEEAEVATFTSTRAENREPALTT